MKLCNFGTYQCHDFIPLHCSACVILFCEYLLIIRLQKFGERSSELLKYKWQNSKNEVHKLVTRREKILKPAKNGIQLYNLVWWM
jgi:hypothetical protein